MSGESPVRNRGLLAATLPFAAGLLHLPLAVVNENGDQTSGTHEIEGVGLPLVIVQVGDDYLATVQAGESAAARPGTGHDTGQSRCVAAIVHFGAKHTRNTKA